MSATLFFMPVLTFTVRRDRLPVRDFRAGEMNLYLVVVLEFFDPCWQFNL